MAYEDSDYIVVIAIVHWYKRIIIVQKLTLVVELWTLLSPCCPAIAQAPDSTVVGSIATRKGPQRFCP